MVLRKSSDLGSIVKSGIFKNVQEKSDSVDDTKTAKKIKKKPGRKKRYEEPLDVPVTINFTKSEKLMLDKRSEELLGAPITVIIRDALKQQNLI